MLKADLHLHTREDKYELTDFTAKKLIDHASKLGFEVLSITNHDCYTYDKELADYAMRKNILLIPGIERSINKKHVLLYNVSEKEALAVRELKDLAPLRRTDSLIVAPHPFFHLGSCLGRLFEENIQLFDAVEYSHFHTHGINRNRKACAIAAKNNLPVLGNSDAHFYPQFNKTYSLIDSPKDIRSVIAAVKHGKVKVVSQTLSYPEFAMGVYYLLKSWIVGQWWQAQGKGKE